jgi:2-(1,2-epoxy-1,2-dihydrophenyl)acetyl-CoA isomerase
VLKFKKKREVKMSTVKTEMKEKGVFVVTLNRPKVLNSLNKEIIDELLEAFDTAYEDKSIRTVVLTGEGRGFCSGADLAGGGWPSDPKWSPGESTANAMEIGFNPLVRKIVNCPKPVVNAINGIAAGGGVGLALCGDLVLAADTAKFKLVFGPQLGIISDVGASWLVPNLLGRAKANGMALLGEDISATQAEAWGLIWKVFPEKDLLDEACKLAGRMADGAITGLKAIVKAHDNALQVSLSDQLDYERDTQRVLCDGAVFKEGVQAFLEKRKPNFRDIEEV